MNLVKLPVMQIAVLKIKQSSDLKFIHAIWYKQNLPGNRGNGKGRNILFWLKNNK